MLTLSTFCVIYTAYMYTIIEVTNYAELLDFIRCEGEIWRDDKTHILPFEIEELSLLSKQNPMLKFCKTKLWYVKDEKGAFVGRIGVIINELINNKIGIRTGRFTRIAFIDNKEVAALLINTAKAWLSECGCVRMDGPLGFNNLDRQGALTMGFDREPSTASDHTPEYVARHLIDLGFSPLQEWEEFRLDIRGKMPLTIDYVCEYVHNKHNIICRTLKRSEFDSYIYKIFDIFNIAFEHLFGTFHFSKEVTDYYYGMYKSMLHERNIVIAETEDGQMLGFTIWMPSLSKVQHRAKGKISLIDKINFIIQTNRNSTIDLLLSAVLPEWQGRGVAALLAAEVWHQARKIGAKYVETTAMLVDNKVATQMWRLFPHEQHKRKMAYQLKIEN
ncbi:MAG: GNAT family N-acetyltransferase [Bacteroidales bacterium]|nr:GNAT family N-acetyltransferase [Bacteroidales bacterium]